MLKTDNYQPLYVVEVVDKMRGGVLNKPARWVRRVWPKAQRITGQSLYASVTAAFKNAARLTEREAQRCARRMHAEKVKGRTIRMLRAHDVMLGLLAGPDDSAPSYPLRDMALLSQVPAADSATRAAMDHVAAAAHTVSQRKAVPDRRLYTVRNDAATRWVSDFQACASGMALLTDGHDLAAQFNHDDAGRALATAEASYPSFGPWRVELVPGTDGTGSIGGDTADTSPGRVCTGEPGTPLVGGAGDPTVDTAALHLRTDDGMRYVIERFDGRRWVTQSRACPGGTTDCREMATQFTQEQAEVAYREVMSQAVGDRWSVIPVDPSPALARPAPETTEQVLARIRDDSRASMVRAAAATTKRLREQGHCGPEVSWDVIKAEHRLARADAEARETFDQGAPPVTPKAQPPTPAPAPSPAAVEIPPGPDVAAALRDLKDELEALKRQLAPPVSPPDSRRLHPQFRWTWGGLRAQARLLGIEPDTDGWEDQVIGGLRVIARISEGELASQGFHYTKPE